MVYPIEAVLILARVGKADSLEGQDRGRQLVAVWELEVEGALVLHWRGEPSSFHLVQDLLFTLGLLHQVGVCSCTQNKLSIDWVRRLEVTMSGSIFEGGSWLMCLRVACVMLAGDDTTQPASLLVLLHSEATYH